MKKNIILLTDQERKVCDATIGHLKGSGRQAGRARILRQVDADGPHSTDRQVAEAFRCRTRTVESAQALRAGALPARAGGSPEVGPAGPAAARRGAGRPRDRASPGAVPCGLRVRVAAPAGATQRTGHCGLDQSLDRGTSAPESNLTRRRVEYSVIPPDANAGFAAAKEGMIGTDTPPYDPAQPVACMDEQPVQLVKDSREPLAGGDRPRAAYESGLDA